MKPRLVLSRADVADRAGYQRSSLIARDGNAKPLPPADITTESAVPRIYWYADNPAILAYIEEWKAERVRAVT